MLRFAALAGGAGVNGLKGLVAAACVAAIAACATPARFEWGDYENALQDHYEQQDKRENYRKALVEAIRRGERADRVAPGLYAELGYLLLEDGKIAEAKQQFELEMAAFPESQKFLRGVMTRLDAGAGAQETAGNRADDAGEAQAADPVSS